MSLNRYEQALFDYWQRQPDERRHWQARVAEIAGAAGEGGADGGRCLERELWTYFEERSAQVPSLSELQGDGVRRVSLLNLAEHIIRLWGPPPKQRSARRA